MKSLSAIVCLCAFMASVSDVPAEIPGGFATVQKSFIKKLYDEKRYFDCIAETRRLLHHVPSLENREDFLYFIDAGYFMGGQYLMAAARMNNPESAGKSPALRILHSQALVKLGRPALSLGILAGAETESMNASIQYELLLRKTEILITLGNYREAAAELEAQKKFFSATKNLSGFHDDVLRYKDLHLKSPGLAAVLSAALPGAGQVYTGKPIEGLISLVAVAVAGFSAHALYSRGNEPMAYTMGFFTALFYGGSIYGAANSAAAVNLAEHLRFTRELRQRHIPPYDPMKHISLPGVLP